MANMGNDLFYYEFSKQLFQKYFFLLLFYEIW